MSNAMMDTLATDFRILGRVMQETWGGLRRTGWMNLVIVITMASILSIFGTLFAFIIESHLFLENIGSGMEISVYAKDRVDVAELQDNIEKMPYVQDVTLISKQKAWEDMKSNYQIPDIDNPLPDTLHVKISDHNFIESSAEQIREMPGVENVNYAQKVLEKLNSLSKVFSLVGMAVAIFFGVLTVFVISNTIHLLIEARQREIEILRMMGVGNWYIRLPFLFQGALYGFVGAFVAYLPLRVAEYYINQFFQMFQFSTSDYSLGVVFIVLLLLGAIVGAGGSALSVHRFLKI
ncbi:MAG: cell division protein FtsX [Candidatus Melainabacteria bacterium]